MGMETNQYKTFQQGARPNDMIETITIGVVVDTNDPQQMGRVRAICTQWGDSFETELEDIPWAMYCSPFGGMRSVGTRGPGVQESEGNVAYGMWAIPKVNAQVLIMCVDGNPSTRVYLGCVYDQFVPHTLPHGRFMYDDHPELEKTGPEVTPYGPFTSQETSIEPLASNMKQAFGDKEEPNHEWRTRAADYTATAVDVSYLDYVFSNVADDKNIDKDNWTNTQGYSVSRIDPHAETENTDKNYDSSVYSITSPGFHSWSMDDRQENCRVRFRTTAGHQIIMDDTNERIYVATAQGNNWIEMDQDGNIDIFTTNKVNVHAVKDINFTSDETIRMYAKKGIHMYSEDEVRIQAKADIHVKTDQNIRSHAEQSVFMQAGDSIEYTAEQNIHISSEIDTNIKVGGDLHIESLSDMDILCRSILHLTTESDIHISSDAVMYIETSKDFNLKSGAIVFIESESDTNLLSGSSVYVEAGENLNLLAENNLKGTASNGKLSMQGDPADPASSASVPTLATSAELAILPDEQPAFFTNRVPDHEPWPRCMTADDFTHELEFDYEDSEVNRMERGRKITRGMFWRR